MKICLYQFLSNSENKTDVVNRFVHTVVVEAGPYIPKQSEVMNGHNEDPKTLLTKLLKEAETVRLKLYYQAKRLEGSVNGTTKVTLNFIQ